MRVESPTKHSTLEITGTHRVPRRPGGFLRDLLRRQQPTETTPLSGEGRGAGGRDGGGGDRGRRLGGGTEDPNERYQHRPEQPSRLRREGIDYETRRLELRIQRAKENLEGREMPEEFRDDEHFNYVFDTKYVRIVSELRDLEGGHVTRDIIREKAIKIALRDTVDLVKEQKLRAIDPLTGIWSRAATLHHAEQIKNKIDGRKKAGYITWDIDRFKGYNDTFGHHVGDLVLQASTNIVGRNLKTTDTLGRIGGEEFLIVAPDITTPEGTSQLAEKIRRDMADNMEGEILAAVELDLLHQREEVARLAEKTGMQGLTEDDIFAQLERDNQVTDPLTSDEVFDEERRDRYNLYTILSFVNDLKKAQEILPHWRTTASFGVLDVTSANKDVELDILLDRADTFLYQAKGGEDKTRGRNRVFDVQGDVTERYKNIPTEALDNNR